VVWEFTLNNLDDSPLRAGIRLRDKIGITLEPNLHATQFPQKNIRRCIDGPVRH